MRRVAVYAGTRNIYEKMATSARSLLAHTHMDRVIFLMEDDQFPEYLPDVIECINVSGQRWFNPKGPNYQSRWTYMALMRLVMPAIIVDEARTLWLDCDTIVLKDLEPLFDLDMNGMTFAMVEEPKRSISEGIIYHNSGVVLMDLNRMLGVMGKLVAKINSTKMQYPDQDVINHTCQGKILTIPPVWNSCPYTGQPEDPAIVHFAAQQNYAKHPLFMEYADMDWQCV